MSSHLRGIAQLNFLVPTLLPVSMLQYFHNGLIEYDEIFTTGEKALQIANMMSELMSYILKPDKL